MLKQMQEKKAPKEKSLNIKVRSVKGDKTLVVNNNYQVEALKSAYLEALELTTSEVPFTSMRFFCMGKELKDELFLYSYDINDDMVV